MARIAAANAITILVRSGTQFNGADLREIKIPGADLSLLEGADLRKVNLQNIWLRQANLRGTQMDGVQFGELPFLQEDGDVHCSAYSPDGKTYATGLQNGDINLYDTSNDISSLAFSPKGDQMVSGNNDGTIHLWDIETGNCLHTFKGHIKPVSSVVYSPDGGHIASGSHDYTARLWDVNTGTYRLRHQCAVFTKRRPDCVWKFSLHSTAVEC
ncbi:hypothetical protein BGX26_010134 [Mortierella sp. AD094]|nr:hypothetical protein BGX26_010134 [Mortierella sp. AD094]